MFNMIKDLENLATKYQKISAYAIKLKQENFALQNQMEVLQNQLNAQIDNLQHQLTLLIEDKLKIEQKNSVLYSHLKHIKQSLIDVSNNINLEILDNSMCELESGYNKDTNVLYATNATLSITATAIDSDKKSIAHQHQIEKDTSVLFQSVSELDSAQEQVQNNENYNNVENTQQNDYINNEKIHHGLISTVD